MRDNIYFVIPAYNEADNLPYLIESIIRVGRFFDISPAIVVVDDASTDGTIDVLRLYQREVNLTILTHEKNLGPGAAFRSGFSHLLSLLHDNDIVVTIEADNTSDLCVLGKMVELVNREYDVVLANVYGTGRIVGAVLSRRFISFWSNLLMKIVFRIHGVDTYTSFFRTYRGTALRRLFLVYGEDAITEKGFTCMLEILVKFNMLGMRIGQVPMLLDSKIRIGESKMKVIGNIKATLSLLGRYLLLRQYRPISKSED